MTYQEALQYIHSVSWKGSRPGLSRISELMARLGNPERGLRYIHVVGTNGKGSTSAMLASILTAAGYKTGLFTSPHLVDFRERMQIGGEMIPKRALAAVTAAVRPHIDAMADSPTEFERITAIALCWFAREHCDIVVLEAGMGGEFDATNVIPSKELAVFTNIGLDHTEYLGDTVEQIAATKAGILTPGCRAVLYPNDDSVTSVITEACAQTNTPLYQPVFGKIRPIKADLGGQSFDYPPYTDLFLPLPGAHQLKNAAVVLTAVGVLRRGDSRIARVQEEVEERAIHESPLRDSSTGAWRISDDAVHRGLADVRWPGRFEVVRTDPPLILDGGHNDQCIDALCRALAELLPDTPLTIVTGVLADKDYPRMYAQLAPFAGAFFTLTPDSPRALPAEELANHLRQYGKPVTACTTVREALSRARARGGPVLCCGSLYLIGEIKKELVR